MSFTIGNDFSEVSVSLPLFYLSLSLSFSFLIFISLSLSLALSFLLALALALSLSLSPSLPFPSLSQCAFSNAKFKTNLEKMCRSSRWRSSSSRVSLHHCRRRGYTYLMIIKRPTVSPQKKEWKALCMLQLCVLVLNLHLSHGVII